MSKPDKATAAPTAASGSSASDAIGLLKGDHREMADLFEEYAQCNSVTSKLKLAREICQALRVHMSIEEEIFYPAFMAATGDKDLHNEAVVEHGAAKKMLREIEASSPEHDYFDAKIKVLSEMIRHHVHEEEHRGGMFDKARRSDLDLKSLGITMFARKIELESEQELRLTA